MPLTVCLLNMTNQRVRAKMEPTVARITQTHRAGLSTSRVSASAVVVLALRGSTAIGFDSDDFRNMKKGQQEEPTHTDICQKQVKVKSGTKMKIFQNRFFD